MAYEEVSQSHRRDSVIVSIPIPDTVIVSIPDTVIVRIAEVSL